MAFSDYKNVSQVQQQFNIRYREENFIVMQKSQPPAHFVEYFEFSREHIDIYASEAARSEVIISPLLREVYKDYHQTCSFWIQKPITYDKTLSGTPDYIVSTRSALGKTVLGLPLLIVVEAKKNDFEQGWGQCLAELVASQKINNDPEFPLHGIVTDGKLWEFGRLTRDAFTKNIKSYTTDDLDLLFGALHYIFNVASQKTEQASQS